MSIYIGFCGGPCSGKTLASRALTNKLCLLGYNADYIPEYARFHIGMCRLYPSNDQRTLLHQYNVLENQLEWENAIPQAVEYVITDSPVLVGMVYTYNLCDFDDYNQMIFYHRHYQRMLSYKDRYRYLFYLPAGDVDFKGDGLRAQNEERARKIGDQIKGLLILHNISYHEITGTLDERIYKCLEIMGVKNKNSTNTENNGNS
jgi:nicotinamide riboside kinase